MKNPRDGHQLDTILHAVQYQGLVGSSLVTRSELDFLSQIINDGDRVLEIGTYCAATIARLALSHPLSIFFTVDTYTDGFSGKYTLPSAVANWRKTRNLHLLIARPEQLHVILPERSLNLIFVDGDHSQKICARDLRVSGRILSPGGTIAIHDYNAKHHEVQLAVDGFVDRSSFSIVDRFRSIVLLRQ